VNNWPLLHSPFRNTGGNVIPSPGNWLIPGRDEESDCESVFFGLMLVMKEPKESSVRRLWESITPTTLLCTSDGRPLSILSTGTPNADGGPDYTNALVRLDGRLFRGDVEIHRRDHDWFLHRHQSDTHYNMVILHVVGVQSEPPEDVHTAGKRTIPTLVLPPQRIPSGGNAFPKTSRDCVDSIDTPGHPRRSSRIRKLLRRLGWSRIERRVRILESRLTGLSRVTYDCNLEEAWDQLLYEGFVEGLGYAKNKHAFRELAQILSLSLLRSFEHADRDTLMAMFFGVSGLLPSSRELSDRESKRYVLQMRRRWREIRKRLRCPRMHEADWLFFRLRPVNFPTARIAALVYLLPQFLKTRAAMGPLACFSEPGLSSYEIRNRIRQMFVLAPDGYWRTHLDFRTSGPGLSIALGADRIDAIIVNTLLPMALLHARLSEDHTVRTRIHTFAREMPALTQNSVTRTVGRKVFGGAIPLNSALLQYGAIELWKLYCEEGRCERCPLRSPASPRATRIQMSDFQAHLLESHPNRYRD
jgi:hypothetical protein